jgi:hypothetical protein
MSSKRAELLAIGLRARCLSATLCALFAVGLLVPRLAGAAWTPPADLSAAGQDAGQPQVAIDVDGDSVIVWVRSDGANDRVQARARSAAGTLSAVQTLSAAGQDASFPEVAVDADGDAVITWLRSDGVNDRVEARARSAAGTLSAVRTLSADGQDASFPQVAVDADGDAVFTWGRSDGANDRIEARARSAAGTLSPVQTLSVAGQNAGGAHVAVDAAGDAVFTWVRIDGASPVCCFRAQTRARSAGGALSGIQNLSAAGHDATEVEVAVDADGDAVFTWVIHPTGSGFFQAQARARSAAGVLGPVETLTDPGQNTFVPSVAVDPDGDAVFTWARTDGTNTRAQTRARSAAGTLSAVQTLSAAGQDVVSAPQVAVDADGDAVFTWARTAGPNYRVQARTRSVAGSLSAVQTLSAAGQDALEPQVAADADGNAVVTWSRDDGTNTRVQASAGP